MKILLLSVLMLFLLKGADESEINFDYEFKGLINSIESGSSLDDSPIKVIVIYNNGRKYLTLLWSIYLYNGLFDYMEAGDSIFLGHGKKMDVLIKKNTDHYDGERHKFFTEE